MKILSLWKYDHFFFVQLTVAYFTKEVKSLLAKRPLKNHGRFASLELTSLVKEATGVYASTYNHV